MQIKKTLVTAITLFAILTSASAFLGDDFSGVFTKMIEKIRAIKMTGDPDSDFAHVMAEHNQGAIDLANVELKSGKDEAVKAVARKVLTEQQAVHAQMMKHFKKGKVAKVTPAASGAQQVANQSPMEDNVKDVIADIEKWMKKTNLTGDPDKEFILAMEEHYKDQVKIANIEIRHGKNQAIKNLATKAKNDSQSIEKEITDWLSSHSK
jgi:uncharacterized protein (DUF305 family)